MATHASLTRTPPTPSPASAPLAHNDPSGAQTLLQRIQLKQEDINVLQEGLLGADFLSLLTPATHCPDTSATPPFHPPALPSIPTEVSPQRNLQSLQIQQEMFEVADDEIPGVDSIGMLLSTDEVADFFGSMEWAPQSQPHSSGHPRDFDVPSNLELGAHLREPASPVLPSVTSLNHSSSGSMEVDAHQIGEAAHFDPQEEVTDWDTVVIDDSSAIERTATDTTPRTPSRDKHIRDRVTILGPRSRTTAEKARRGRRPWTTQGDVIRDVPMEILMLKKKEFNRYSDRVQLRKRLSKDEKGLLTATRRRLSGAERARERRLKKRMAKEAGLTIEAGLA